MRYAAILFLASAACSDASTYAQATCVLVDTSGTYADQQKEAVDAIARGLLPRMLPGDTLVVARIDGDSYERDNITGILNLDNRPSRANAQKLAFSQKLRKMQRSKRRSRHTDISGGMMLCSEYLGETGAGSRVVILFSDMKEELPRGARRQLEPTELSGTNVLAMNVKKLQSDAFNPARYRGRLDAWEQRLTTSGAASWRVVYDASKLSDHLEALR